MPNGAKIDRTDVIILNQLELEQNESLTVIPSIETVVPNIEKTDVRIKIDSVEQRQVQGAEQQRESLSEIARLGKGTFEDRQIVWQTFGNLIRKNQELSRDRLEKTLDAIKLPYRVAKGITKIVGTISLGVTAGATAAVGGMVGGATGAIIGTIHGLINRDKGYLQTIKEDALHGISVGVGLPRLPFEITGLTLQFLGKITSKITSWAGEKLNIIKSLDAQRKDLAQPLENGILTRKGVGKVYVEDFMDEYRQKIKSPLSKQEMISLINTGERIVKALNDATEYRGGTLEVKGQNGFHSVRPDTYTVRAVSWYLTTKAAVNKGVDDNIKADQELLLNRGSMVVEDPKNKLYYFLKSAPTVDGRVSTHFSERSQGLTNWWNRLIKGGFIPLTQGKSPLQLGIEDYDNKMPSEKGCILFDKIKGRESQNELMIKFECAGVPSVIKLTGQSDGWNPFTVLGNKFRAISRCIAHGTNFIQSRFDTHGNWGDHREDIKRGIPGEYIFTPFKELFNMLNLDRNQKRAANDIIKQAGTHGLYALEYFLDRIQERRDNLNIKPEMQTQFNNKLRQLREDINTFYSTLGGRDTIERKGAELHLNLKQDYLNWREVRL